MKKAAQTMDHGSKQGHAPLKRCKYGEGFFSLQQIIKDWTEQLDLPENIVQMTLYKTYWQNWRPLENKKKTLKGPELSI